MHVFVCLFVCGGGLENGGVGHFSWFSLSGHPGESTLFNEFVKRLLPWWQLSNLAIRPLLPHGCKQQQCSFAKWLLTFPTPQQYSYGAVQQKSEETESGLWSH